MVEEAHKERGEFSDFSYDIGVGQVSGMRKGQPKQQQDRFLALEEQGLYVVADGAGGHGSGDKAAELVTSELAKSPHDPKAALIKANQKIDDLDDPFSASTFTGFKFGVTEGNQVETKIFHGGDSRLYVYRQAFGSVNRELHQITEDEITQVPVSGGYRDVVANGVGHPKFKVTTYGYGAQKDDVFLLVTDGALKAGDDSELKLETLCQKIVDGKPSQEAVDEYLSNEEVINASDNVTAVAVHIKPE